MAWDRSVSSVWIHDIVSLMKVNVKLRIESGLAMVGVMSMGDIIPKNVSRMLLMCDDVHSLLLFQVPMIYILLTVVPALFPTILSIIN